ncbi:MAG: hypothetical protein RLZZ301_68 [Bacteroidota bacterium]|jgi:uncharacterized YigZ family protein
MARYKTIAALAEGFYKEKGSKFYAFAVPVQSEDEIKAFIAQKRKEHHQAVHVCSAFRLGADLKTYRASDDGEPSNSAGPPILGQIQSYELSDVLIAVVRYYGGTNLGVGGLIQAYRSAAKDALEQATVIEKEEEVLFEFEFPYEKLHFMMELFKKEQLPIVHQGLGSDCHVSVRIPLDKVEEIKLRYHAILVL